MIRTPMLSEAEIKQIFARAQAIITGDHFVYAKKSDGWYHGYDYVNKDAVYPDESVNELCQQIADHFLLDNIDTVVGPTVGGVALAQSTARWLREFTGRKDKKAICADEEDVLEQKEIVLPDDAEEFLASGLVKVSPEPDFLGHFGHMLRVSFPTKVGTRRVIKRGYDKHVKGKRCLIVEDVINSGNTVAKTRDAILAAGGEIVGVGCLCNRSGGKVTAQTLCVPELFSLVDVDMKMFKEEECPICKEKGRGSVRLDLGKGKEFLNRIGIKPGDM